MKKKSEIRKEGRKKRTNATPEQREAIFRLVAGGTSVREVAAIYGLRYTVVRNIVLAEWQKLYPIHFRTHAYPASITKLRDNHLPVPKRPKFLPETKK